MGMGKLGLGLKRRANVHTAISAASVVGFVVVWWIATERQLVPYLPSPVVTTGTLIDEAPVLARHTWVTIIRAVPGFALGSLVGVLLPIAVGWSPDARSSLSVLVNIARGVPGPVLIPIFLLWFGTGEFGRVVLVSAASFFVLFVVTTEAIDNVPLIYQWAAASLGLSKPEVYRRIVLPAIVPGIMGGLRVSVTTAFPLSVVAEFLGAQQGLGYYLWHQLSFLRMDRMLDVVIIITVAVVVGDLAVQRVGSRVTAWSGRED